MRRDDAATDDRELRRVRDERVAAERQRQRARDGPAHERLAVRAVRQRRLGDRHVTERWGAPASGAVHRTCAHAAPPRAR